MEGGRGRAGFRGIAVGQADSISFQGREIRLSPPVTHIPFGFPWKSWSY